MLRAGYSLLADMIHGLERAGFPPLKTQFSNAVGAAMRAAWAGMIGASMLVPPDVELQRQLICSNCEENRAGRCRVCGCGVSAQFIRKTHLATEKCPLNPPKWLEWAKP